MRILVLTNLYPPHYIGGYELICQTVVEILRERGHAVSILCSDHGVVEEDGRKESEPDTARALKIHGLYGHPWHGILALRELEAHNNKILRESLARFRPDLVYVWNMGGLSKSMLFSLQSTRIPAVYYVSDHWMTRGFQSDVWLSWWNESNARARHRFARNFLTICGIRRRWSKFAPTTAFRDLHFPRIYFCSRALRRSAADAGLAVDHGAVIYCPVHQRFFQSSFSQPRKTLRRLLYAGRLAPDKGVVTALRALVQLRGKLEAELTICGRGEPEFVKELQKLVSEHRLRVNFVSVDLEDMPELYRNHDLLLFTSEWQEPFALTPIEAMACGLPVIGTTTGGSAELFRDGENGLVYTAGNAEELAAGIWHLASDYELRSRCARTAFNEARERFAAPVIVDQIERYLLESIEKWEQFVLPNQPPCQFHRTPTMGT